MDFVLYPFGFGVVISIDASWRAACARDGLHGCAAFCYVAFEHGFTGQAEEVSGGWDSIL
jgi:hypothetical protein